MLSRSDRRRLQKHQEQQQRSPPAGIEFPFLPTVTNIVDLERIVHTGSRLEPFYPEHWHSVWECGSEINEEHHPNNPECYSYFVWTHKAAILQTLGYPIQPFIMQSVPNPRLADDGSGFLPNMALAFPGLLGGPISPSAPQQRASTGPRATVSDWPDQRISEWDTAESSASATARGSLIGTVEGSAIATVRGSVVGTGDGSVSATLEGSVVDTVEGSVIVSSNASVGDPLDALASFQQTFTFAQETHEAYTSPYATIVPTQFDSAEDSDASSGSSQLDQTQYSDARHELAKMRTDAEGTPIHSQEEPSFSAGVGTFNPETFDPHAPLPVGLSYEESIRVLQWRNEAGPRPLEVIPVEIPGSAQVAPEPAQLPAFPQPEPDASEHSGWIEVVHTNFESEDEPSQTERTEQYWDQRSETRTFSPSHSEGLGRRTGLNILQQKQQFDSWSATGENCQNPWGIPNLENIPGGSVVVIDHSEELGRPPYRSPNWEAKGDEFWVGSASNQQEMEVEDPEPQYERPYEGYEQSQAQYEYPEPPDTYPDVKGSYSGVAPGQLDYVNTPHPGIPIIRPEPARFVDEAALTVQGEEEKPSKRRRRGANRKRGSKEKGKPLSFDGAGDEKEHIPLLTTSPLRPVLLAPVLHGSTHIGDGKAAKHSYDNGPAFLDHAGEKYDRSVEETASTLAQLIERQDRGKRVEAFENQMSKINKALFNSDKVYMGDEFWAKHDKATAGARGDFQKPNVSSANHSPPKRLRSNLAEDPATQPLAIDGRFFLFNAKPPALIKQEHSPRRSRKYRDAHADEKNTFPPPKRVYRAYRRDGRGKIRSSSPPVDELERNQAIRFKLIHEHIMQVNPGVIKGSSIYYELFKKEEDGFAANNWLLGEAYGAKKATRHRWNLVTEDPGSWACIFCSEQIALFAGDKVARCGCGSTVDLDGNFVPGKVFGLLGLQGRR